MPPRGILPPFLLQCFVDFFCFLSVVDCENYPDYYVYNDENSEPD